MVHSKIWMKTYKSNAINIRKKKVYILRGLVKHIPVSFPLFKEVKNEQSL